MRHDGCELAPLPVADQGVADVIKRALKKHKDSDTSWWMWNGGDIVDIESFKLLETNMKAQ